MNTEAKILKKRKSVGTKLAIASLVLSILPAMIFLLQQGNYRLNDLLPTGFEFGINVPPAGFELEPSQSPSREEITEEMAVALLISILIAILAPVLLGLFGLILGVLALTKNRERAASPWGKVMAFVGIVLGIFDSCFFSSVGLAVWIFMGAIH